MAGESLAKLMTTRIIAMPHFHNYPTVKAFHIKMSRLYKMLLHWFPGNRPLRCDSLGNFVVNFHCYYQFSGGSTFLLKCCWLVKKKEQQCLCGLCGRPCREEAGRHAARGPGPHSKPWGPCVPAGLLGPARWLAPSGPTRPSSGTLTARCPKVTRTSRCVF